MNFTSKGTREILIAGCQDHMFKVDVEKGAVTEKVRSNYAARDEL
jgi:PAB-dependent poly(A)-specific ribonuclease subunit 2